MQRAKIKETNLDFSSLNQRKVTDMIVVHHTGNRQDDDLPAETIHRTHKANGWAGIGYHYVVRKDGTIERGRPHWTVGAHAEGENWHTIGIHVCGNFEAVEPTKKQIEALAILIGTIASTYGLPVDANHVVGHRDLMPTACPGANLYKELQTVRGKAIWYQQN